MQTLLQFFHAEGNGLTIEDMKNSDHKVSDKLAFPGKKRAMWV